MFFPDAFGAPILTTGPILWICRILKTFRVLSRYHPKYGVSIRNACYRLQTSRVTVQKILGEVGDLLEFVVRYVRRSC